MSSLCVCRLIQHLADFHETLYEIYATGNNLDAVVLNFLQPVIITWQKNELLKWERW
jgi:hypothetical protein